MADRERKEITVEKFIEQTKTKIPIDRNDLDTMWVEQPQVYQEIAERLALEISYRDEAKDGLKDYSAELDGQIREEDAAKIERDGGKKMTETAIANACREDKQWKKMNASVATMSRNVGQLQALKETFQMRRYALQDLVALHISGYSMQASSKPSRDRAGDRGRVRMQDERKRRQEEE